MAKIRRCFIPGDPNELRKDRVRISSAILQNLHSEGEEDVWPGPLRVGLVFWTLTYRMSDVGTPRVGVPDIDNLVAPTLNAMSHIFYDDDSAIADLRAINLYGLHAGIDIVVADWDEAEPRSTPRHILGAPRVPDCQGGVEGP